MKKMLVTDIDGTLTDGTGKIPKENKAVIQSLIGRGIHVVLCTGRNITKAKPVAKELGIVAPIICIDGILLYDQKEQTPIYDLSMTDKQAEKIIEIAKRHKLFAEVSNGYCYYKHIHSREQLKYDFFNSHSPFGILKSYFGGVRYLASYDKLKRVKGDFYQVTIACGSEHFESVSQEILKLGFEDIDVRNNLWDGYIFVNRKGIDKSRGIGILCEKYCVSPSDIVSIGDDLNDLGMLKFCGTGVAMGNSPQKVKDAASFITKGNNEGGFAFACRHFFEI
ncbi:HAD family hydrolase [Lachnospiraceae bacterium NSJ-143]|nr:HAD family hydrolase [Lachnospiraceae bacterium NSJ-143]